jgi:hypothetical protein
MPNETLDAPAILETDPTAEFEEIGEVALDSIPVFIDSDPARTIHEEFTSVSPRLLERVGRIYPETIPETEITASKELTLEQPPAPEAHNLAEFEELLGQQLNRN